MSGQRVIAGSYNEIELNMKMIRKIGLLVLIFIPLLVHSQDLIILRNGDSLNCKITKSDSLSLYYTIRKNDRKIDSFIEKNEIRSYQISGIDDSNTDIHAERSNRNNQTIVLDTTVYVKNVTKWINMITYSQKYGIHANGWEIQGYGYFLKNDSKWILPITYGIEDFQIDPDYFSQSGYQSARMNYYMVGISPLRKLNDYFYVKIGLQMMLGSESFVDYNGYGSSNEIWGLAPSQGLMFIPKSKTGICIGVGVQEKLLTSVFYQNDFGLNLEIGIKF